MSAAFPTFHLPMAQTCSFVLFPDTSTFFHQKPYFTATQKRTKSLF